MCKERWRTRDLLLEYNQNIMPPRPRAAGLGMVYPWENFSLTNLSRALYILAQRNGFIGTEKEFLQKFGELGKIKNEVIICSITTFPTKGEEDTLYLDSDTDTLYYFKEIATISLATVEEYGLYITHTTENTMYAYIPVRALPIENTILNCGDASEYIG